MARHVLFVGSPKAEHVAPALRTGLRVAAVVKPRGKRRGAGEDDGEPGEVTGGGDGATAALAAIARIEANLDDAAATDATIRAVAAFHARQPVDACLTRYESLVPLAARIADALGLRGPGVAAADLTRDKLRMREAFAAAGVPQPRFSGVSSQTGLERAADALGLPLMVKPLSGAHSRHVYAYRTREELAAEYTARERAFAGDRSVVFQRGQARAGESLWVAEQLVTGRQVTTTTVVTGGEPRHLGLVDVVSTRDLGRRGFQLVMRTSPARLAADQAAAVEAAATAAVRALGLRDTCAHPELILTPDGPVVIEVAARVGGFRAQIARHALGIDLDAVAVAVALGDPPDLSSRHMRAATAVEVWPERGGVVVAHRHADAVRATPGIVDLHVALAPGDVYVPPPDGQRALATFYAVADDASASAALAREAIDRLEQVELAPPSG